MQKLNEKIHLPYLTDSFKEGKVLQHVLNSYC